MAHNTRVQAEKPPLLLASPASSRPPVPPSSKENTDEGETRPVVGSGVGAKLRGRGGPKEVRVRKVVKSVKRRCQTRGLETVAKSRCRRGNLRPSRSWSKISFAIDHRHHRASHERVSWIVFTPIHAPQEDC